MRLLNKKFTGSEEIALYAVQSGVRASIKVSIHGHGQNKADALESLFSAVVALACRVGQTTDSASIDELQNKIKLKLAWYETHRPIEQHPEQPDLDSLTVMARINSGRQPLPALPMPSKVDIKELKRQEWLTHHQPIKPDYGLEFGNPYQD